MTLTKFLLSALLGSIAIAAPYQVQPIGDSKLALTVEKTGLYRGKRHLFLFEKYQGSLEFDPRKQDASRIELRIDSRSLICKDEWLGSSDLKKVEQTALDDILAVQRFPTMTFLSTAIKPLGANKYETQGVLTIRGIAKPANVTVELDAKNPEMLRLVGTAIVRLTDYKLKPPSALLGAIGTKNEMTLSFTVIATK